MRAAGRAVGVAVVVAAVSGSAACVTGPLVDPLEAQRKALREVEGTLAPAGFRAEATALLSSEMFRREVDATIARLLQDASRLLTVELTPGVQLQLAPSARVERVLVRPSAACAACVELDASLAGDLRAGGLGALLPKLAFTASAVATLDLHLERAAEEGGAVELRARAVPGGTWKAHVVLADLPPELQQAAGDFIARNLVRALEAGPPPSFTLAELPPEGPVRIRGVRARPAAAGVALDFAFAAVGAGAARDPAACNADFCVAVPARTALALAQAAAVRSEPVDGHVVEPTGLALDDGRFALTLRLWRVGAGPPTSSTYRVHGVIALTPEGDLALRPSRAEEVGAGAARGDLLSLLVRAAVLEKLQSSLRVLVPGAVQHQVTNRALVLRVSSVKADDDVLLLEGKVHEAEDAAAALR